MLPNDDVSMSVGHLGMSVGHLGPRLFPGHVLHRAVNSQDVIKMSDGHRNVVIR